MEADEQPSCPDGAVGVLALLGIRSALFILLCWETIALPGLVRVPAPWIAINLVTLRVVLEPTTTIMAAMWKGTRCLL